MTMSEFWPEAYSLQFVRMRSIDLAKNSPGQWSGAPWDSLQVAMHPQLPRLLVVIIIVIIIKIVHEVHKMEIF